MYRIGASIIAVLLITLLIGGVVSLWKKPVIIEDGKVCVMDSGIVKVRLSEIREKMEFAYFEGQRDALMGDVRIAHNDSVWYYTKSCWDSLSYIPKNTSPYRVTNVEEVR